MNQNDQMMREVLDRLHGDLVCLDWAVAAQDPWEQIEIRVKDMRKVVSQALNHTPDTGKMAHVNETSKIEHHSGDVLKHAPLVRLTLSEKLAAIEKAQQKTLPETINRHHALEVAQAIMDAMEKINQGETK